MDLEEGNVRDQVRIQIGGGGKEDEQETSIFKQFDTINDSFFTNHHYYYSGHKSFSPQTIERISHECDILKQGLPDSIFVRANKVKPDLLRAVIIGPEGTPHHDGLFFFDIYFPSKFPNVSPKIRSVHPCGFHNFFIPHPCPWTPSTSTLLESLFSIWRSQISRGSLIYISEMATLIDKEMVYRFNWSTMGDVLNRPPKYFENFVARHFYDRAEIILTTCKAYIGQRVDTVDHPDIRAPWQEEFDMMESHYYKLVDAFQKNGSFLADLSKLGIEFHGKRNCSPGLQIVGWVVFCIGILGIFALLYFMIKDLVSRCSLRLECRD